MDNTLYTYIHSNKRYICAIKKSLKMLIFKSIKILKPLCNFFIRFEDSINQSILMLELQPSVLGQIKPNCLNKSIQIRLSCFLSCQKLGQVLFCVI